MIMRILYDIFFIIFGIFYLPYLVVKGKLHKGFAEKFGFLPKHASDLDKPVWIHAVSVGEALVAVKLAEAIKKREANVSVIVSTTTRTGNDIVRKHLSSMPGIANLVFYYPLDISWIVERTIKTIDPALYVMIETEMWPNLLRTLKKRNVPVVLVNGRISDGSFANYKRFKFVISTIVKNIGYFCMQSEQDALRIEELGASVDKISVTGNMKFSERLPGRGNKVFKMAALGVDEKNKIIIAGSTHFPEEKTLISVFKKLKGLRQDLNLILAPRHIERTGEIEKLLGREGLSYTRLSSILKGQGLRAKGHDVLLVNTIGHLSDLYGVADIVFIGGSLVHKGGQNPIEAAKWGRTVIFGPDMSNFKEISRIFLDNKAAIQVKDAKDLNSVLKDLLSNREKNLNMSRNAMEVISNNADAIDRTMDVVMEYVR